MLHARWAFALLCVIVAPFRGAAASDLDVIISEIHYHPLFDGEGDRLEFLELHNRGPTVVDLSGWSFSRGISFAFEDGWTLAPGERLVVSPSPDVAGARWGLSRVAGPYVGSLENDGEIVELVDRSGRFVHRVRYRDDSPWPARADGRGPSLEYADAGVDTDVAHRWRPSRSINGTPGAPNSRALGDTFSDLRVEGLISEVGVPGDGLTTGFVELFGAGAATVDLSEALILSSAGALYVVPAGTSLAPGERLVFDEGELGFVPDGEPTVWVVVGPTGDILDDLETQRTPPGAACARVPEGSDDVYVTTTPTAGAANEVSLDRRVVINEVYFHPEFVPPEESCATRCSDRLQWVELHNTSDAAVSLSGWRLTKGVRFDFPVVEIAPRGFLVVAASVADFRAQWPGVADVLGPFEGRLSWSSDDIHLKDDLGNIVDGVEYSDGGPRNDLDPEDGVDDRTIRVSDWPSEADGTGRSIELAHPLLDNAAGSAWRASADVGGTPGGENSARVADPGPVLRRVRHAPAVPTSTDAITVTCRVSSVAPIEAVEVAWEVDGGSASGTETLRDDGASPDEVAGDGEYSGSLPPRDDGELVRFRVRAVDDDGREMSLPLQPEENPYPGFDGHFFLYEVDDAPAPENGGATYRVLLTRDDAAELGDRSINSDVLLAATFIAQGGGGTKSEVRHLVGVRYRGENSRREDNKSFRIDFRPEATYEGIERLNLNGSNDDGATDGAAGILTADFLRRAGEPCMIQWASNLRFPGETEGHFDTRYVRKEALDDLFLDRVFAGSDTGSLYRARDPGGFGSGDATGDLEWHGDDPDDYRGIYEKKTWREEDDFGDIIDLCRTFDPDLTADEDFPAELEAQADVAQWARFFATMACVSNTDGGIWSNNGEDYGLYRVPDDSTRADAGKWLLLPWDIEETFQNSNEVLFRPTVDSIRRFLTVPEFAQLYYRELAAVRRGAFRRSEFHRQWPRIEGMFPPEDVFNVVDGFDAYIARRHGYFDVNVASRISASVEPVDAAGTHVVIDSGDDWRYVTGADLGAEVPPDWMALEFDDSEWPQGPSGFGYGDGDDRTFVDMEDSTTTLFVRRTFDVADRSAVTGARLRVSFDDAFIAYLNGVEVARTGNAPNGPVSTDGTASGSHEADGLERFDVDIAALVDGINVLAIVGFNREVDSSDFSLEPVFEVDAADVEFGLAAGCGERVTTTGRRVVLRGLAEGATSRALVVAGESVEAQLITRREPPWGLEWSAEADVPDGGGRIALAAFAEVDEVDGVPVETASLEVAVASRFETASGTTAPGEVWSRDRSPIWVTSDVEVPEGETLRIEAGVDVLLADGASIIVRGLLEAEGTPSDPIRLRPYDCESPWGGVALLSTGAAADAPLHVLRGVRFEGGTTPDGLAGTVSPDSSRVLIESCEFVDLEDNAVDAVDSRVTVRDCLFLRTAEAVHTTRSTTAVEGCVFRGTHGDHDAIDFDLEGEERSRIAGNRFEGGTDDAIDLGSVTVDIEDNVFRGYEDKAISIESPGALGQPVVRRNAIFDCSTGVAVKNGIDLAEAHHLTIVGCRRGLTLFAKDESPEGGAGAFHSSIIWSNVSNVSVDELSAVTIEQSDVEGGWPGSGNIDADPRFVDMARGELDLAPGSPCIGAGRDGSDMGAFGFEGPVEPTFIRGDADRTGTVDISDAIGILAWLFQGGGVPACLDAADANDDGTPDISDAIAILRYLFAGGGDLPAPAGVPGVDPTADALGCG